MDLGHLLFIVSNSVVSFKGGATYSDYTYSYGRYSYKSIIFIMNLQVLQCLEHRH